MKLLKQLIPLVGLSGGAIVPAEIGFSGTNDKIIGGSRAAFGEYPFMAIPETESFCGASLIHEDILLTAAHCQGAFPVGIDVSSEEFVVMAKMLQIPFKLLNSESIQTTTTTTW
jgi:hypothetical protein